MKYDFTNHEGLKRVKIWSNRIHGKQWSLRKEWCEAVAVALVNNDPLPEVFFEGGTKRPWRAATDRLRTIERLLADQV